MRNLLVFWLNNYEVEIEDTYIPTNLISELTDHYLSCSYGNEFFSELFYVFLSMKVLPKYRKQIYNELSDMLNLLKPPSLENPAIFLFPLESDFDMLLLFANLLTTNKVDKDKNPFLYWVVVHHMSSFVLAKDSNMWFKQQLVEKISPYPDILQDLLSYQCQKDTPTFWGKSFTFFLIY
jgi:hypothetical protein